MIKKIFIAISFLLILLAGAAFYTLNQAKSYLATPLTNVHDEIITISAGSSFNSVVKQLTDNEWLEASPYLRLIPKLRPELTQLKAGTFQLEQGLTFEQALLALIEGKEHQFSITFVEGSRFSEWLVQLQQDKYLRHTLNDVSEKEIAQLIGSDQEKLEGLFLAETYYFTLGTTDLDLLKRAHQKLNTVLEQEWQEKAQGLPLNNAYEALILASIIEKETGVAAERERVSSVFINRLNIGMRLQTDPTVIYGMGDSYEGNIRKKDLRTPTPYNTYTMSGLPPTPIAMAGRESIHAALHPEDSPYFYFVASGKGGHVFSKTLAEHNRAVRAYLKELRKNR
ncbi:ABC transporter substrate-binding protein [Vibrio sp. 10N.286.49.B3]|uniref:endolytic transglycosylase MltG n=1 Tax=Vibrio sp. 10N.286.49.B3 TaxID=1880855 RepID=UPI000C84CB96|nr:endolytic transglycosylase MltG [Vibrio sp. 10N.286.49.B3]PMH46799.1 ABC transporter substrate-binding protein [Vibrio sp. 10N.286.49.B3]